MSSQNGYLIRDLEVTQPVVPIDIPQDYGGVALVLRRDDRPIGFCMAATRSGESLSVEAISALIRDNEAREENTTSSTVSEADVSLPSLTFAICTRNRQDVLGRCLERIVKLDRHGFAVEVLVIDNAPTDDRNERIVAGFPGVRCVREPRPGLSFARNRAISEARNELIAYVDDDAVVDRGWLRGLREAAIANPDAAGFSGPILPLELVTGPQIILEGRGGFGHAFRNVRYNATMPGSSVYPCGEAGFGAGGNMVIRKQVLLSLGGFDEALGSGTPAGSAEDLDIFFRLVRAGHTWVHEPQIMVFHQNRRDMASLRRQVRSWGIGNAAYMLKAFQRDPELRPRIVRFLFRLVHRKTGGVAASMFGLRSYRWPVELALAELQGTFIGLMGSYSRSSKQIEKVRAQFS
jgi:glycosyltransferase involved in cell wall biosynthesis